MSILIERETSAGSAGARRATRLKFPGRKDKNLNRFKQIAQN